MFVSSSEEQMPEKGRGTYAR